VAGAQIVPKNHLIDRKEKRDGMMQALILMLTRLDVVAAAAVVGERRQQGGTLVGSWGRGVSKGDASRSLAVGVEGGNSAQRKPQLRSVVF
jgi:hypothetical protein